MIEPAPMALEAIVPLPRHNGYVSMYQGRRTPRSVKGYMLALSMDNHIPD